MCDWWSFGILLYELLYGNTPFFNQDTNRMYDLIKSGAIAFPKFINMNGKEKKYKVSDDAKDIISKLLEKDPGIRLGRKGLKEIKKHPFFSSIKFDSLQKKKIKAPFIPKIDENNEFENFDEEYLNLDIKESPVEKWLSEYENWFDRFDFIGVQERKDTVTADIIENDDDYNSD